MKKTIIKIISGVVLILILTSITILLNFFIIGNTADISHLEMEVFQIEDNKIDFEVHSFWSAKAIKSYDYKYDNNILSISFTEVVVSNLYPLGIMDSSITGDFKSIKELRLIDDKNYRIIWSNND